MERQRQYITTFKHFSADSNKTVIVNIIITTVWEQNKIILKEMCLFLLRMSNYNNVLFLRCHCFGNNLLFEYTSFLHELQPYWYYVNVLFVSEMFLQYVIQIFFNCFVEQLLLIVLAIVLIKKLYVPFCSVIRFCIFKYIK